MTYIPEVLDEDVESFEDLFLADDLFKATQSTDVGVQNASSLQDAKDKISSITTDEFLIEAYNSATQLRNTLGDADALVADLAENIRMNILVVALSCRKDPAGMILSAARVMGDDQESFIVEAISKLQAYKQALAEG
jgi:hypothetical protein